MRVRTRVSVCEHSLPLRIQRLLPMSDTPVEPEIVVISSSSSSSQASVDLDAELRFGRSQLFLEQNQAGQLTLVRPRLDASTATTARPSISTRRQSGARGRQGARGSRRLQVERLDRQTGQHYSGNYRSENKIPIEIVSYSIRRHRLLFVIRWYDTATEETFVTRKVSLAFLLEHRTLLENYFEDLTLRGQQRKFRALLRHVPALIPLAHDRTAPIEGLAQSPTRGQ